MKDIIALLEHKLIMLKRKYRDRGPVYSANYAPIRESILNYINSKGKVSYTELKEFIQRFNESEGRNTSIRSFLRTNGKYIIESEKNGERYFKLSEYGKRFLSKKLIIEAEKEKGIDEKDLIKEDDVQIIRQKSYIINLKDKVKFKSNIASEYEEIKRELEEELELIANTKSARNIWFKVDNLTKDIYGEEFDVLDVILTAAFQNNLDSQIIQHIEKLLIKEAEEYAKNKMMYENILKLKDLLISGEFATAIKTAVKNLNAKYE
jgi:hypothetical protein